MPISHVDKTTDAKDIDRSANITRLLSFLCLEPTRLTSERTQTLMTRQIYASTGVPPTGSLCAAAMRKRARAFFPSLTASAILA